MEQVLASHPAFVTTEEASPLPQCFIKAKDAIGRPVGVPVDLPDLSVVERNRMREHFVAIGREVTGNSLTDRILVDKLPLNLAELGVANWLFPDGKAIVALRDPRDAVLSCYMQHFQINTAMMQFLDLERSAKIYALVMDIWLHYREILTMQWVEYRYEDLVADFEGTVRKILDFAGPGWHDAVNSYAERAKQIRVATPSYAAVIQPINSRAVSRWRNYREQLAPILPILAPYVEKFGYDPD